MSISNSNSILPSSKHLLYTGLGLAAVGGATYLIYKHFSRDVIPQKWKRVGVLQEINLYPLKSGGPAPVTGEQLWCDLLGLSFDQVRDRSLMLINENNEMITARAFPRMLLIEPTIYPERCITFSAPGMPDLQLDLKALKIESKDQNVHTAVWGVKLDAFLCGSHFDTWFSQFLLEKDAGLKLVYYPYPKPVREIVPRLKDQPFIQKKDTGTFVDATSFMLMNLASIADLNSRLKHSVSPKQFRGNFELKMDVDEPYAEDHWDWLRIGDDAVFRVVAPCTRCILPNINVTSAERDVDGEPLKTLRRYRLFDYASPALGIHLGLRVPGHVKANDVIYIPDKSV